MKNSDWVKLRAKLHHDWLQNRYITFLNANMDCINNADSCIDEIDDILDQLLEWRKKHAFMFNFIENAIDALSPRQLLDTTPLSNMGEEDRIWIGELVHTIYLQRTQINGKIQNLKRTFCEVDRLVELVASTLKGEKPNDSDNCGNKLLNEIFILSKQISALPNCIQTDILVE